LVNEKMAAKDEKKEDEPADEKSHAVKIGDVSKVWSFQKETEVGVKFWENIPKVKPSESVGTAAADVKGALEKGVRGPLEKLADALMPGGASSTIKRIVAKEVTKVTNKIVATIIEITTLDGFMESAKIIAGALDKIEDSLKDEKSIEQASQALWHAIVSVGMTLYTKIQQLEDKVKAKMDEQPEEAVDVIVKFLDNVFEVQIRAFNSIRIQYINNLQATLKDAKDPKEASRAAFRTAIFSTVDLLGNNHWVKLTDAFTQAAIIIVTNAFRENIWPDIAAGLEEIQSMIPDEIAKMGLQIEPLAWSLVAMLLQFGVKWVVTKVFIKMEAAIFTQGGDYGSS